MSRMIGVNESGQRVGQYHHRAKLSDAAVDEIRMLREETGLSLKKIADKFEIGIRTVRDIVEYRKRAQFPTRWKQID